MLFLTFLLSVLTAFADTSEDLHKAIQLAGKTHPIVRDKTEATDNSQLLQQIDQLVTPYLNSYLRLNNDEKDLLAEAMVHAAQSDNSYSLAAEHLQVLKRYENWFSRSIEKLIARGTITRAQADLFFNGIELGDSEL